MNSINLEKIIVKNNRVDYFFFVKGKLEKYFTARKHLFFEYNFDVSEIPQSIMAIPFLANIIPLIWITNSTVSIDELDKSFYESLNEIRNSYQTMFPNVRFKGRIFVKKIIDNAYVPETEAASLFSGGLDALTTFIRIKHKKPVLITEYGWHENTVQASEVWEADKKNAIAFAQSYGLKNILIQSNYGTFIIAQNIDYDFNKLLGDSWWHGLHHGLAIISAAIPIAYKLKIKCIYIASSNSPIHKVACASDPTVDNKIKYASGKVFHDAYELTRQDKVKLVVDYYSADKKPVQLRVCFRNQENCCVCEKCLRTIMAIVAEGKDPRAFGFNLTNDFSQHIRNALNKEVKFFTDTFITIYWQLIQDRMKENSEKILFKDLLNWFLAYDFKYERKKALLEYRLTNFFPILKRKLNTGINRIFINV
ncbi:MAG: hypothetical protein WA118_08530 [Carboxydocellales bacterium]